MKKSIALILTLALLAAASVNAFAASPITTVGGSDSADVKGTYVAGGTSTTVYSVDIAWGSMEFTYTDASEGTWNPATHAYDGTVAAAWSCATDANKITVTNHSNAAVEADLTYSPKAEYNGITGTFSVGTLSLATADGTAVASAPTASATLTLSGALGSATTANTVVGTATVTLN